MASSKNDFKTLKRKDLQRLCKKYGLRANSTNSQMANDLASFLKNCEKNIQEEVEGNAEKVLIILDEEDDEHDLNLKSCSGINGVMEETKVQWHEENSMIFLDEEDHNSVPVHTDELVQSKVNLTSSQILGGGASPNLASSSQKLLLSEWKGEQEKFENPQRFPDSQRQVEIKSGQIALFEFSKRVDNALEKLLCLTKILRGEISLVADSSLPAEEEISHEDCEQNSTNSETLDGHFSIPNEQESATIPVAIIEVQSKDISMSRTDTFTVANPSEHKGSVKRNAADPIEEISRKFVKLCISSSQKPSKSNIINTPRIKLPGTFKLQSSMGNLRDKENAKISKLKNSSKRKMRNSASAGSIRRPLQSITNQMID